MADEAKPQDLQESVGAGAVAEPTATPPAQVTGAMVVAAGGVAAWNNNRQVNALWSINQDKNSWMGIAGIGWVKLSNSSDTGIIALTVLAAHAYQTQHVINYRQEADGMVHEIYAW